jgi:hypothetical protein
MSNMLTIRLGCETKKEVWRSPSLGVIRLTERKTWLETIAIPEKGYNKINILCPICHSPFRVKVYSKARARRRKFYFASCFFTIAACGIVFGAFAGSKKGFMGYSIAAPFVFFTVWQLSNAIRGRFDPSDIVSHAGGKIHRIYDEKKVIFPD